MVEKFSNPPDVVVPLNWDKRVEEIQGDLICLHLLVGIPTDQPLYGGVWRRNLINNR